AAVPDHLKRTCGVEALSLEERVHIETALERVAPPAKPPPAPAPSPTSIPRAPITVSVWVHVVTDTAVDATTGKPAGYVSDAQIANQVRVLNAGFSGALAADGADTGYRFALAG